MVKRPSIFFHKKNYILTRFGLLDWRVCLWATNKVGYSFGLGLWKLHTMDVQIKRPWEFMAKGLGFGLGVWRLHSMPCRKAPIPILYSLLSVHFFRLSTNLAIQSQLVHATNLELHNTITSYLEVQFLPTKVQYGVWNINNFA